MSDLVGTQIAGFLMHRLNYSFPGLLTEPEGKSSVVMIWGYTYDTKKWEAHIIDFKDVIPRKCRLQLLPMKGIKLVL